MIGPLRIAEGQQPGGLLFQTWAHGQLVFEHRWGGKGRPEELEWPDDVDFRDGEVVTLVVFDGDTGVRFGEFNAVYRSDR